jgi:ParB-like chromosome segregation protein Spo0J
MRKLGTGKIDDEAGTRKWAGGVKSQIAGATQHKGLNARYVPLSQITLDPENPRRLAITPETVRDVIRFYPLDSGWIKGDTKDEWWDEYAAHVGKALSGKVLTDFLDTLLLALSIKHHERLINPVTVYAADSGTDLRLIAGERRFLAHVMLGEETIAARILPHRPDDLEKDILQWEENNQRLELSLHEQLNNLQRLLKGWEKQRGAKLSVGQMVALAGLPRVTAHRYLTVIRCPHAALMTAIEAGQISSLKQAAALATLSTQELDEALQPASRDKKPQPIFRIKRSGDYSPIKAVLRAAAEQLGGKHYLKLLDSQELESAEGIAEAFDQLVKHVAAQQSHQH